MGVTSVGVVVLETVTGDPALNNRFWTSVVACELIPIEIQRICETEKQTKRIFVRALCPRNNDNGAQRPTNSHKVTRLPISLGIGPVS
jgi:hypothetical protein